MGIISDFKAVRGVQKIKNGKIAKLSISQIVNLIINLPDAKRKLSQEEYEQVYWTYKGMRECKVKLPMNMEVYCDLAIKIIKDFDLIAPYEKYSGGAEFEYSLLMEDIFGKHHDRIRQLRRDIAALETELKEMDIVDAKNAKMFSEAFTDDQLSRMVARGEFPANKVKEYAEARKNLENFVRNAPNSRKIKVAFIDDLKKQIAELEADS